MRYHDSLRREAAGWRFVRRSVLIDWTETRAAQIQTSG